jgi:PadR family transcriptional regulator, regulatory protein PadR
MSHTLCVTHYVAPMEPAVPADEDLFETLRLELRRGSLVLAVLACLRTERYGYTLRQALAADGLEMEESTLYPLLRRLEGQGLLLSEWREEEKRRKRFYVLSDRGLWLLDRLTAEWRAINGSLDRLL